MYFTGSTLPGKPRGENEDWLATTSDLVVVLDGATVRTDTGCRHGVPWYARKLGAGIIAAAASHSNTLQNALSQAIQDVADLHRSECDLTHPGTPSAAAAIVRFEAGMLRFLVLGDVSLVLDTANGIEVIADNRVSLTASAERARSDAYTIGSEAKQAAMLEMKHAELAARNVPGGYWIAAADPLVAQHAIVGGMPITDVRRIAVMTDGAARAVELFATHTWASVLGFLENEGPGALIGHVRSLEGGDPIGERYPRNKKSDDATAVFMAPAIKNRKGSTMTEPRIINKIDWSSPEAMQRRAEAIKEVLRPLNSPAVMGAEPRVPNWVYRQTHDTPN